MSKAIRSTLLVLLSLTAALLLAPAALAAATPTLPPSPAVPQGAAPAIRAAVGGGLAGTHASALPPLNFISASAATKLAPTGGLDGDLIGSDVAVSGSVIAVGAPLHNGAGVDFRCGLHLHASGRRLDADAGAGAGRRSGE